MSEHTLYAKRVEGGEWANAVAEVRRPGCKYECTDCGHGMKLRQWRGIEGTRCFRSHFSHIDLSVACPGRGGESEEHYNAKHMLREFMGSL